MVVVLVVSSSCAFAGSPKPAGRVTLDGHALRDDRGHFPGLGVTYMTALHRAKFDRDRLHSDLAFLAKNHFDYIRVLTMVGWWPAWDGREIAPVSFTNKAGKRVEAWPDYWQQLSDLIDLTFQHGLRTQLTIFADAQLMPARRDRIAHLERILQTIRGREHKVILLEVANEAWQNGFPGESGIVELREYGKFLNDRTEVLVALSAPEDHGDVGIIQMYRGAEVDIATVHLSRDLRTPAGAWGPVLDSARAARIPGIPPISSNEPIGPGSSVAEDRDETRLVAAAALAWASGLPMYVYHSEAGVFGTTRFEDQPGITSFGFVRNHLPPDVANRANSLAP